MKILRVPMASDLQLNLFAHSHPTVGHIAIRYRFVPMQTAVKGVVMKRKTRKLEIAMIPTIRYRKKTVPSYWLRSISPTSIPN